MDLAMKNQPDFLEPLLKLMQQNAEAQTGRMDKFEAKMDANTATTQKVLDEIRDTNGRVSETERAIKRLQTAKGKKLALPPNVIYLIALGAVILLAVIATLLHVNIGGLLK